MPKENKTLEDFLGEHRLSGVILDDTPEKEAGFIRFVLDGTTIQADQDPDDGYRSTLGEIYVSEEAVPQADCFATITVMGLKQEHPDNDILELVNVASGKVVLSFGTDNTGDYYPSWHAQFNKEAL